MHKEHGSLSGFSNAPWQVAYLNNRFGINRETREKVMNTDGLISDDQLSGFSALEARPGHFGCLGRYRPRTLCHTHDISGEARVEVSLNQKQDDFQ